MHELGSFSPDSNSASSPTDQPSPEMHYNQTGPSNFRSMTIAQCLEPRQELSLELPYHRRTQSSPNASDRGSSGQFDQRLSSGTIESHHRSHSTQSSIDIGRLRELYADHSRSLWNAVASAYSLSANYHTAQELELAFLQSQIGCSPLHTVAVDTSSCLRPSPSSKSSSYSPWSIQANTLAQAQKSENSPQSSPQLEKCSVSALLN